MRGKRGEDSRQGETSHYKCVICSIQREESERDREAFSYSTDSLEVLLHTRPNDVTVSLGDWAGELAGHSWRLSIRGGGLVHVLLLLLSGDRGIALLHIRAAFHAWVSNVTILHVVSCLLLLLLPIVVVDLRTVG
jgi:hypothetical protein